VYQLGSGGIAIFASSASIAPSGFSSLWFGPATKPSSEIEI
jgi:hypothetical protein